MEFVLGSFLPRADWIPWLAWPQLAPGLMHLYLQETTLRHRLINCWIKMIFHHLTSHARGQLLGLNALEEVLLWCDSVNPLRADSSFDPRIGKAMDFLSLHLSESFSEERFAKAAGLSPSRLRYLFRKQTGDSPRQFHERQRLRKGMDLLSWSRLTIGEIATELGFNNPFYFTLRFKKETGENPRDYRRRTTRINPISPL